MFMRKYVVFEGNNKEWQSWEFIMVGQLHTVIDHI